MAELENKLNQILDDPEAMGKIMALARSLSGGGQGEGKAAPEKREETPPAREGGDLSGLLEGADPDMVRMGLRLLREYQGEDSRSAALLSALRPFLKEERRARLDRALELVRMTRLIRAALEAAGGKGENGDV